MEFSKLNTSEIVKLIVGVMFFMICIVITQISIEYDLSVVALGSGVLSLGTLGFIFVGLFDII